MTTVDPTSQYHGFSPEHRQAISDRLAEEEGERVDNELSRPDENNEAQKYADVYTEMMKAEESRRQGSNIEEEK